MGYDFFYDIAEYANISWNKNGFTPKEVACGAYEYLLDFKQSCKDREPVGTIAGLLQNLKEDISDPQACQWVMDMTAVIEGRYNYGVH